MTDDKKPRGDCIDWHGKKSPKGYGQLNLFNKTIGVHRLAWAMANGRMPKKNMDICHHCDNPSCVNPVHLFEGTRSENMIDAAKKNRIYAPNKYKKYCKRGHEFNEENTIKRNCGRRACRICQTNLERKWRDENL